MTGIEDGDVRIVLSPIFLQRDPWGWQGIVSPSRKQIVED
jgi:hypothetical protein